MKNTMKKPFQDSWLDYLQNCPRHSSISEKIKNQFVGEMISINSSFLSLASHSIPMVYLLDYTTGRYLSVSDTSKGVIGHTKEDIVKYGIEYIIEHYHKDHLKLLDSKIFPDRLQSLNEIDPEDHKDYVFTYNFSFKNRKGTYRNLLQRNIFVKSDSNGKPLLSAGMVINIENYHKANPVIQTIEKMTYGPSLNEPEVTFKKAYFLNEEDQTFSKREKEILLWMADGKTSKDIARILFISEDTVIVHRKNMMLKSGSTNVAALIAFAFRHGII
jgi:DNA-binding CsgD family transcriptional regulator